MKCRKKNIYLIYMICFLFIFGFIAFFYYPQGKTLVNSLGDGYRSHYKFLVYYSDYLKQILTNIFVNHSFIIPQFDFAVGEGSDIIQTFYSTVIGDPFNLISVFFNTNNLYICYDLIIFLKLYFAGIAFLLLCEYKKVGEFLSRIVGALIYVFCFFALYNLFEHPIFLNPMAYQPLIILGIEKVLNKEKPTTLVLSVFIAAISNIYVFYMIVIVTAIYAIIRVLFNQDDSKKKIIILFKLAAYCLLGVLMSSILFLPSLYTLISNTRLSMERGNHLLYPVSYYAKQFISFVMGTHIFGEHTGDYSSFGGYGVVGLLAVIALFKNKGHVEEKTLITIALIWHCLPVLGKIMNGMSYPIDRWIWAFSLIISYIVVVNLEKVVEGKNWVSNFIIAVIYFVVCIVLNPNEVKLYILFLLISTISIICLKRLKHKNIKQIGTCLLTAFCLLFQIFNYLSPYTWNYAERGTTIEQLQEVKNTETNAISTLNDKSFFRYSGDELETNESILGDKSSTQFYNSIANNYVTEFRKELGLLDNSNFHYDDYNDRYALMSLASIKYYIDGNKDNTLPYNYDYLKNENGYDIYENKETLPLIYGYKDVIAYDEWHKLNSIEKEESLTKTAVIELSDIEQTSNKENNECLGDYLNYDLVYSNKSNKDNNNSTLVGPATLTISFVQEEREQVYLLLDGLYWDNKDSNDWLSETATYINVSLNNELVQTISYKNNNHQRYSDKHEYLVNLGLLQKGEYEINIDLCSNGEYTLDNIKVYSFDNEIIDNNLKALNNVDIKDLQVNENVLACNIGIKQDEIVCFSIPYSEGWKAYVNGKEVNLLRVNEMYMGLDLKKGDYDIELKYETPYLVLGSTISLISLCAFIYISKKMN